MRNFITILLSLVLGNTFSCFAQPGRTPKDLYFQICDAGKAVPLTQQGAHFASVDNRYQVFVPSITDSTLFSLDTRIQYMQDRDGSIASLRLDKEKSIYTLLVIHDQDTMKISLKFKKPPFGVYTLYCMTFRKGNFKIDVEKHVAADKEKMSSTIDYDWDKKH